LQQEHTKSIDSVLLRELTPRASWGGGKLLLEDLPSEVMQICLRALEGCLLPVLGASSSSQSDCLLQLSFGSCSLSPEGLVTAPSVTPKVSV